jgi:uncharacterized protein (DUF2249 family)
MSLAPYDLDVRPILREGGEPFSVIMAAVAALAPGQPLRLLATFKPLPLFQVLGARGFEAAAREIGGGDWEVIFTPADVPSPQKAAGTPVVSGVDQNWPEPEFELDLRDLDPPEPMVRALECAESLAVGRTMAALLPREPVFLLEELNQRGHPWRGAFLPDNGYRIIVRAKEGPMESET